MYYHYRVAALLKQKVTYIHIISATRVGLVHQIRDSLVDIAFADAQRRLDLADVPEPHGQDHADVRVLVLHSKCHVFLFVGSKLWVLYFNKC